MGESQLVHELDLGSPPDADAARSPLSDAVQGQDGRLLVGRRKESAGGVRLVVLGEDVATFV